MRSLIGRAFLNALGTGAYIGIVISIMRKAEKLDGTLPSMAGPAAFLMLFVLSAAVTGGLVIGKPVLMYMDGKKKEAVQLFLYTLGWLAVGTVILLLIALSQLK